MQNLKTTWDFVEKFYPNYTSSSEITENNDLQKIIEGDITGESFIIYKRLKDEIDIFNGHCLDEDNLHDTVIEEIEDLKAKSDATIYEKAIQGFIDSQNKQFIN